jgi:hypothetical protein
MLVAETSEDEDDEAHAPSRGWGDWDTVARSQDSVTEEGIRLMRKGMAFAMEDRNSSATEKWRPVFVVPNSLTHPDKAEVFDARSIAIDEPSRGVRLGLLPTSDLLEQWGPSALYRSPNLRPAPRDRGASPSKQKQMSSSGAGSKGGEQQLQLKQGDDQPQQSQQQQQPPLQQVVAGAAHSGQR